MLQCCFESVVVSRVVSLPCLLFVGVSIVLLFSLVVFWFVCWLPDLFVVTVSCCYIWHMFCCRVCCCLYFVVAVFFYGHGIVVVVVFICCLFMCCNVVLFMLLSFLVLCCCRARLLVLLLLFGFCFPLLSYCLFVRCLFGLSCLMYQCLCFVVAMRFCCCQDIVVVVVMFFVACLPFDLLLFVVVSFCHFWCNCCLFCLCCSLLLYLCICFHCRVYRFVLLPIFGCFCCNVVGLLLCSFVVSFFT